VKSSSRRRITAFAKRVAAAWIVLLLVMCMGGSPGGAAERGRSTVPLLPPPNTIYLGAFVNFLKLLGPYEVQTAEFEQQIGRTLAIHAEYHYWADVFPGAEELDDFKHGRIPVVSWDCGATATNVINGSQDQNIISHAQAFKAYGHKIFLRYYWEMNLPYAVEGRNSCYDPNRDIHGYVNPQDYVNAWIHIRSIFAAQGATNVVWVWCPSGSQTINPLQFFPGANEVDWAGFDHYDLTGKDGLKQTLEVPYKVLAPLGKPMMVGETGTTPHAQPLYLSSAPAIMQQRFPMILGFMYYDAYGHRQDWRLTPAGVSAFAAAGATPYFSGHAQLGADY
jgi:hypothetical protein